MQRFVAVLLTLLLLVAGCSKSGPNDMAPPLVQEPQAELPKPEAPTPAPTQSLVCLESPSDREIAQWVTSNKIPLHSLTAGAGFDDLQPLKEILKDVRVVGLGEATHGTSEFYTMRHRLVEFLVKEMDFQLVGLEADYPAALVTNGYISGDVGTPLGEAVRVLRQWIWRTEEVQEMVEWLRLHNAGLPAERQVQLLGFDLQSTERSAQVVPRFFREYAREALDELQHSFLYLQGIAPPSGRANVDQVKAALRELQGLEDFLVEHEERLARASSPEEVRETLALLRNLRRYYHLQYSSLLGEDGDGVRDLYMAQTVLDILEEHGPDSRIVIWGHNMHIHKHDFWMGAHLAQALGDQYYALGFAMDSGSVLALERSKLGTPDSKTVFQVGPAPPGSYEWDLTCAQAGNSLLDLRQTRKPAAVTAWLSGPRLLRAVPGAYSTSEERQTFKEFPLNVYDGLIFIPETTATRPIR